MNYTVLGLFKSNEEAKLAKERLLSSGFDAKNIDLSAHKSEGEFSESNYQYKEDENTGGFWNWLFGDDEEQKSKYSRIGSRADIISVYTDSKPEADKAKNVLDQVGALDPDEFDNNYGALYNQSMKLDSKNLSSSNEINNTDSKIDVVKEELNVGKRKVETGTVQVRTRIIEKPVQENIRLKNERVYIKRNKVNKPASETNFDGFREGTIELKETAERAVINKEARVVEEIEVGKETSSKNKVINETVRETEVDVDVNMNAEKMQNA